MIFQKLTRSIACYGLFISVSFFAQCTSAEKEQQSNVKQRVPTASAIEKDKYIVDTESSKLIWHGSMLADLTAGHTGYVDIANGELFVSEDRLVGGTFQFDMNTMADKEHGSDNGLIRHLKSEDFFEVDKFPLASFGIIIGIDHVSKQFSFSMI